MDDPNPLPTPRYRIEFKGHAQTWEELEVIVSQMENALALRRRQHPFRIDSGGGWHVEVTEPDPTQTPERWADELEAWCERNREIRRASRDGEEEGSGE